MRVLPFLFFFYVTIPCAAQLGCTDPLATNYDVSAIENDGSCTYPNASLSPELSVVLDASLAETSGLIFWENRIWTHNDNADNKLYALNSNVFQIEYAPTLNNTVNTDWEDLAQDSLYIYIGDFGNNSGNRTDLHVLRILKSSFLNPPLLADTIWFHYEDQVDFTASSQETNFDCEALIAKGDSLYVFTKEWTSMSTSVYRFPNVPGDYSAQRMGSWNVNGLITGATWNDSLQCIVLSGYSPLLQPFIYLLYDFQDNEFFSGNKRKVSLNLPFHQAEGVAFADNYTLLVSNEYLQQSFITINQKIHTFDLYPYLSAPSSEIFAYEEEALLFPNPTSNKVLIPGFKGNYRILDTAGKTCVNGRIARNEHVEVGHLLAGSYILVFEDYKRSFTFIIK